jgi:hypothetical protein
MDLPITLDSLIRSVEDSAPEDRLGQLANASATAGELGELGDALLGVFVDRCRRDGRSWSEIGRSLGVTKQAVQKRFVTPGALNASLGRFTPRARNALDHAAREARELRHGYRGTEHLLLGLFGEPEAVAPIALQEMGVTGDQVRDALVAIVPPGAAEVVGDPPFTPRSVRALELAMSSALELGHNYIGTEHMLLGILRERDGLAAQILAARGVDEERAKARVIELLSGYPAP